MSLMVHYVRDLTDPQSEFWTLNSLRMDFASALAVAREGYSNRDFPHASGFRIVDEAGAVITEEIRAR